MADDLDREHQEAQPPDRSPKMLEISEQALSLQPENVIDQERCDRAAERNLRKHRRRLKGRNHVDEVAEQDKDEQGSGEGDVFRTVVMADDLFGLASLKAVNEFKE